MRLLIDTHILLWASTQDTRLPPMAKQHLTSAQAVFVSAATVWEIAIKARVGKLPINIQELAKDIARSGYRSLSITDSHAIKTLELRDLHRDPFDRILIAQAEVEDMRLITADAQVAAYSDRIILV